MPNVCPNLYIQEWLVVLLYGALEGKDCILVASAFLELPIHNKHSEMFIEWNEALISWLHKL